MWVATLILVHPSSPILSPLVVAWIETPWLMITHPRHPPSRKALVIQLLKTPTPQNFLPLLKSTLSPASSHPGGCFGDSLAADMWHWWSEAKDRDCGGSASSADTYMPATIAGHTIYSVLLACKCAVCRVVMEDTKELIELCTGAGSCIANAYTHSLTHYPPNTFNTQCCSAIYSEKWTTVKHCLIHYILMRHSMLHQADIQN